MDYKIDENTISFLTELIQDAFLDVVTEDTEVDWKQLQTKAKNFLQGYEILEQQGEQLFDQMKKTILSADPLTMKYINMMFKNKNLFLIKSKYLLAFQFDDYVKRFRDMLPSEAAFVHNVDNQNLMTYILSMKSLAMSVDKNGHISISDTRLKNEHTKILKENQDGLYKDSHIDEADLAYKGTINRLQRFYDKMGLNGNKRQGGLLMWKINHEWQMGTVLNNGDIKEAYFAFLSSEHGNQLCKKAGGEAPYYNHEFIGDFFDNYINTVTNLAAIVEEDILQYAVKSEGSEMPSLAQYVKTAKFIVEQPNILSKEELDKWIRNEFKQSEKRNVRISLEQAIKKYGQDVLDLLT